ncbi:MAG: surface lipoprotein assembly modifier [Burkholderiales bacterium]
MARVYSIVGKTGRRSVAAFALALATLCASAHAQVDAALTDARRLMAERNPHAAYRLLAPLEPQRAGQPDFDYLLGIAALDAGEFARAIFALERVLAVQPGNALARAEIGRAYLAAGEAENARGELAQVRAAPIPSDATAAVDRLLGAISQLQSEQTTRVRWYVEAGGGHDSNVNSATGSSTVAIPSLGGLVFTLDPASRSAHDIFLQAGAGVNVRVPLAPDLAFSANASTSHTFNQDLDRFDTGVFDASAGVSKTVGAHVFSGAAQAAANWIGGSRFREAVGALGQWQYNLSPRAQTSVFVQATRLTYPGNAVRDADRFLVGAGYARSLDAGPVMFASVYAGREDERRGGVAHLGHDFAGVRGGLQWQLRASVQLFATVSHEERDYGGSEPLFNRARSDRQTSLTGGAHFSIAPGWRLTPQLSYTDNSSNVAIYAFRRSVASLMLRREF